MISILGSLIQRPIFSTISSLFPAGWSGLDNSLTVPGVDPNTSGAVAHPYAVFRGAGVSDSVPAPVLMWAHGSGEIGFNITTVMNAAALPNLIYNNTDGLATFFSNFYVLVPQQPSLSGAENSPSYDQINYYRYNSCWNALQKVLGEINYDSSQLHLAGFSGGGNITWAMRFLNPTMFYSITNAETNAEGRRITLDNEDYDDTSGRIAMGEVTGHTNIWLHENANDTTVTPSANSRETAAAFGTPFTSPWTTAPTYDGTTHRYIYNSVDGYFKYVEATSGGYAPNGIGSGNHECTGIFQDDAWQAWFTALL